MLPGKIAFVDIETTGTSLRRDRIIEIGVLRVENNRLVDQFESLINPETRLPPEITMLTGITEKDLDRAPNFHGVKKDLRQILGDCVFSAHNVRFDYGFVKREFRNVDVTYHAKNLCTVKLSRRLFPRYRRHSLDSLIDRFNFPVSRRHRALDDAAVLWKFYQLVQNSFPAKKVEEAVNTVLKRPTRPIGLSEETLDNLPESPGVYIFYGESGAPLYVGKSKNIQNRVLSHFQNDGQSGLEMRLASQIKSIDTVKTAGELGALLKESQLVKKLQPLYNRQLRESQKMIIIKESRHLYSQVTLIDTNEISPDDLDNILGVFKSRHQAKELLANLAKEFKLCAKMLGLEKGPGPCFGYRLGRCPGACLGKEKPEKFNARFALAFSKVKLHSWPYPGPIQIKEENPDDDTVEIHLIDKWCHLGSPDSPGPYKFDLDTYKILRRYLYRN